MDKERILTRHPDKKKSGKRIEKHKYDSVKKVLLNILRGKQLTHMELFDNLEHNLSKNFDGNINWYGETVKLDLEARKIIERTKTKPPKYRLK